LSRRQVNGHITGKILSEYLVEKLWVFAASSLRDGQRVTYQKS